MREPLIVNGVHLERLFDLEPTVVEPIPGDFNNELWREFFFRAADLGSIALNLARGEDHVNAVWHRLTPWRNKMHCGPYWGAHMHASALITRNPDNPDNLQFPPSKAKAFRDLLPKDRRDELPGHFPVVILGLPKDHPSVRAAESPGVFYCNGKVSLLEIDPHSRAYLEDLFGISFAERFGKHR